MKEDIYKKNVYLSITLSVYDMLTALCLWRHTPYSDLLTYSLFLFPRICLIVLHILYLQKKLTIILFKFYLFVLKTKENHGMIVENEGMLEIHRSSSAHQQKNDSVAHLRLCCLFHKWGCLLCW